MPISAPNEAVKHFSFLAWQYTASEPRTRRASEPEREKDITLSILGGFSGVHGKSLEAPSRYGKDPHRLKICLAWFHVSFNFKSFFILTNAWRIDVQTKLTNNYLIDEVIDEWVKEEEAEEKK